MGHLRYGPRRVGREASAHLLGPRRRCRIPLRSRADKAGVLVGKHQIVTENDNASTVESINSARARSLPMRRALAIVHDLQSTICIQIVTIHIRSEDNSIADRLSRERYTQAAEESRALFGRADRSPTPPQLDQWLTSIVER